MCMVTDQISFQILVKGSRNRENGSRNREKKNRKAIADSRSQDPRCLKPRN